MVGTFLLATTRRRFRRAGQPSIAFAECCRADTPPTSLTIMSRNRPTRGRRDRFVAARSMLLLRKRSTLSLTPAHFPTPLQAPGSAASSTEFSVPLLRAGPNVET